MTDFLRPNIRDMAGYTPGEQPRADSPVIKLNTNENPYPPSPRVFDAIRAALTGDRLRRYPDPLGTDFRQTAGRVLGVDPDSILIGNGSDDILTIVTRAFVPEGGVITSPTPSYLLYRTLAQLQGARFRTVSYTPDWDLPSPWPSPDADLTFLANPNSPSGTMLKHAQLLRFVAELRGPLVIDEAYADFAEENALALLPSLGPTGCVIVSRSLSKSYALAGIRFGFAVAEPRLVHELIKVKDSYNCDVLSLAAATAALGDEEYFREMRFRVLATRARLHQELSALGFICCPSQANFIWCQRSDRPVRSLYEELKRRNILVRYMVYEGYGDGLRISVGTDADIDRLLQELKEMV
jgi:histidinol-phosphate aminotransferase